MIQGPSCRQLLEEYNKYKTELFKNEEEKKMSITAPKSEQKIKGLTEREGKLGPSKPIMNSLTMLSQQVKTVMDLNRELSKRLEPVINNNIPIRGKEEIEEIEESSEVNKIIHRISYLIIELENDQKNMIDALEI